MPIRYKMDILAELKKAGYTTYRIRKEKLLSESTIQKLRRGENISMENIAMICALLHCQPGDMMEYVEEEK